MIYTLTCNPSLDYMTQVSDFQIGKTNRAISEDMVVGGKGINVSLMLKNLGYQSTCFGFVAGFTGKEIVRQAEALGLKTNFIELPKGMSRVNVKLSSYDSKNSDTKWETEVNGIGPEITELSLEQLRKNMNGLENGDILVLSGSIPKSLPDTLYRSIIELSFHKEVKVVVDATGKLLLNALSKKPFLVKPNKQELEELYQIAIESKSQLIECAKKIQLEGAKNVLVSLGGEGAVLLTEHRDIYMAKAPEGKLVNGVGAGDSMIAGFLAGYMEKENYEFAFKMAVAAGSASTFSKNFAHRQSVEELLSKIQIKRI